MKKFLINILLVVVTMLFSLSGPVAMAEGFSEASSYLQPMTLQTKQNPLVKNMSTDTAATMKQLSPDKNVSVKSVGNATLVKFSGDSVVRLKAWPVNMLVIKNRQHISYSYHSKLLKLRPS